VNRCKQRVTVAVLQRPESSLAVDRRLRAITSTCCGAKDTRQQRYTSTSSAAFNVCLWDSYSNWNYHFCFEPFPQKVPLRYVVCRLVGSLSCPMMSKFKVHELFNWMHSMRDVSREGGNRALIDLCFALWSESIQNWKKPYFTAQYCQVAIAWQYL